MPPACGLSWREHSSPTLFHTGLAAILIFIGAKLLLLDIVKIPIGAALGVVGLILAVAVVASLATSKPAHRG
jgi:tellurite resistance protein TerC